MSGDNGVPLGYSDHEHDAHANEAIVILHAQLHAMELSERFRGRDTISMTSREGQFFANELASVANIAARFHVERYDPRAPHARHVR